MIDGYEMSEEEKILHTRGKKACHCKYCLKYYFSYYSISNLLFKSYILEKKNVEYIHICPYCGRYEINNYYNEITYIEETASIFTRIKRLFK